MNRWNVLLNIQSPEEAMALVQAGKESQSDGNRRNGNDGSESDSDGVIKDVNEFISLYMEIGQKKGLEGLEDVRKSVDDVVVRRRENGK